MSLNGHKIAMCRVEEGKETVCVEVIKNSTLFSYEDGVDNDNENNRKVELLSRKASDSN